MSSSRGNGKNPRKYRLRLVGEKPILRKPTIAELLVQRHEVRRRIIENLRAQVAEELSSIHDAGTRQKITNVAIRVWGRRRQLLKKEEQYTSDYTRFDVAMKAIEERGNSSRVRKDLSTLYSIPKNLSPAFIQKQRGLYKAKRARVQWELGKLRTVMPKEFSEAFILTTISKSYWKRVATMIFHNGEE